MEDSEGSSLADFAPNSLFASQISLCECFAVGFECFVTEDLDAPYIVRAHQANVESPVRVLTEISDSFIVTEEVAFPPNVECEHS